MTTATLPTSNVAEPRRVNVRLMVFLAVIAVPFLLIAGLFIRNAMSGGVIDRGGYKDVDLKALGNFPFSNLGGTIQDVPEQFRKLDGQKVRLTGFMYSPEAAGDYGNRFEFVYNVNKCCFNGPPQVHERVFCKAKRGSPIFENWVFVETIGTLHVRLVRDPETQVIKSVYDLDVETVRQLS